MLKYFYCFLAVFFIGTACSKAADDLPHFNIEKYKNTVQEGNHSYAITLPDSVQIVYGDGENIYYENYSRRKVLQRTRNFYKESGILREESTQFHGIPVGSSKFYDEAGKLIRTQYHTDADWVDRLVQKVKDVYHLDLWDYATARLLILPYKGRWVLEITHLNGNELKYPYDEKRDFVFLDLDSFDEVVRGEILYLTSGPGVVDYGFAVRPALKYMVDGKELGFN